MELKNKRITVTGGAGFLGSYIVEAFQEAGAIVHVARSKDFNLVDIGNVRKMVKETKPDILIHAAANVGGIGYNRLYPADIFFDNVVMTGNVLKVASETTSLEKLVIVGSACAYPGEVTGRLKEHQLLDGALHPSVECYGFSKRAAVIGSKTYREQYNLNSIVLMITNLYGPRDKMDPTESHVVAALIDKFVRAVRSGEDTVTVWGTGKAVREFLYASDCADAILSATRSYDKPDMLNIGTGMDTSIKQLVELLIEVTQFKGEIIWDRSKPDGAMLKVLDVSKIKEELNWEATTALRDGLAKSVEWYHTVLDSEQTSN